MGILELIILAVGLAMDAFAVSVCKGLAMKKITFAKAAVCGIWFGVFQAMMPVIGYLMGSQFTSYVSAATPWIAFVLLALIGINMIREALGKDEESENDSLDWKTMLVLAIATSIDALAIGVTFACVPVSVFAEASELINTLFGALVIGVITFAISCIGVKIGNLFGTRYKSRAELTGGLILVLLGVKILLQSFGLF